MSQIDIVVQSIVTHQIDVLGPLAIEQAKKVSGLSVDDQGHVKILGAYKSKPKALLTTLITSYGKLFGQASIEVCIDAIKEAGTRLPDDQIPDVVRSS